MLLITKIYISMVHHYEYEEDGGSVKRNTTGQGHEGIYILLGKVSTITYQSVIIIHHCENRTDNIR